MSGRRRLLDGAKIRLGQCRLSALEEVRRDPFRVDGRIAIQTLEAGARAPKLRHGNVIRSQALEGVDVLRVPRAPGLRMGTEALGVCKMREPSVVVFGYQIGNGAA